MKLTQRIALVSLAAALAFPIVGCATSRDQMRPDMDKVISGEQGLQSRDLREMTDKMAPDLLQIPQIAQSPTKIVIVMKPIVNKLESRPTEDLTIYVARLKALLTANARDRIAFVEERETLQNYQQQELGNRDPFEDAARNGQPADRRQLPQYVLHGTFYEKYEGKTSYYLCSFQLTDINTGVQVWENSYEVRTLN